MTRKDESGAGLLGNLIAGAIAPAMVDQLVNDLVTARSFARLLRERNLDDEQHFSLTRIGFTDIDEYTLATRTVGRETDHGIKLILRRDGITWRVSAIDFGPGDLLLEQLTPLGAGLQVAVSPARAPDSLIVNGKITNTAPTTREIPRLRVALRDGNNADIVAQVIDPPQGSLAPDATAAFNTVFKHPDDTATGVAITFTTSPVTPP